MFDRATFYKKILSPNQRSILIGSALGDANLHINKGSKNAYLKFVHGPKQLDYLLWKGNKFKEFYSTNLEVTYS